LNLYIKGEDLTFNPYKELRTGKKKYIRNRKLSIST